MNWANFGHMNASPPSNTIFDCASTPISRIKKRFFFSSFWNGFWLFFCFQFAQRKTTEKFLLFLTVKNRVFFFFFFWGGVQLKTVFFFSFFFRSNFGSKKRSFILPIGVFHFSFFVLLLYVFEIFSFWICRHRSLSYYENESIFWVIIYLLFFIYFERSQAKDSAPTSSVAGFRNWFESGGGGKFFSKNWKFT